MSKKWYGNLTNRLEEGYIYGDDKTLKEGTDITMYYWSDRTCYYVTKVVDQKHIFVRRYYVCADQDKKDLGMGHQDWVYFKTNKEFHEYLNKHFPDRHYNLEDIKEDKEEEWVFRYGSWKLANHITKDVINNRWCSVNLTEKDLEKINNNQEVIKYSNLSGNVSFNVRDYYYDWEF